MSFDLVILSGARRLDADQARDAYERLCKGAKWSSVVAKDDRVAQFVAALSGRWPDLDTLPKSEVDASPWSGGFEVSPGHVVITMRFSAPEAVVDFCSATALGLGLNVFDPQDGTLYSPGEEPRKATPRPRKTMMCERCGKTIEPGTPYAESPQVLHLACLMQRFS
jgi:hypothetical protein